MGVPGRTEEGTSSAGRVGKADPPCEPQNIFFSISYDIKGVGIEGMLKAEMLGTGPQLGIEGPREVS